MMARVRQAEEGRGMRTATGLRIDPEAWYSEEDAWGMGFTEEVLARARKREGLKSRVVGDMRVYRGSWLEEWLNREAVPA